MTGKQEGPYKGEETKAEEDKLWQVNSISKHELRLNNIFTAFINLS